MRSKININIFSLIFLYYMFFILVNDYITYIFNFNYILSLLLSGIISIILIFITRKIWKIENNFSKFDFFFMFFIGILFVITIVYPDNSFDTMNYHLYLQEHPFGDKIFSDFFAGKNLNSFSYAFPDRMFYLFRFALGYRLGTILNYFLLIIIYNEVKKILKALLNIKNDLIINILSTFSVLFISVIDIVDSYYIDLISVTVIILILNLLFLNNKDFKDKQYNIVYYGLIGLLYGFGIAIKISNAPILILLFIMFMIRYNKSFFTSLNIINILLTIILFIFPFGLYMYYTFKMTGNPVFPFYNTIFKSSYYSLTNWMDNRFGPNNLLEVFFWPIIAFIHKDRCVDSAVVEPMWMLGYLSSIVIVIKYIITFIKNKKFNYNNIFGFALLTFLSYLCWSKFELGYTRYGLTIIIMGGICFSLIIYNVFHNKYILGICFTSLFLLWNIGYSMFYYAYDNTYWMYNNYFNNGEYLYNLKNLFSKGNIDTNYQDDNAVWGIIYYNSGIAQMINNKMPIYTLTSGISNDNTNNIFETGISKYNKIYSPIDSLNLNNFITSLNQNNYDIVDNIDTFTSTINTNESSFMYVFQIEKCTNNCNTKINTFTKTTSYYGNNFLIGLNYNMNKKLTTDIYVQIQKDGIEKDKIKINPNGKLEHVYLDDKNSYTINVIDSNGNIIDFPSMMIIERDSE